VTDLHHTSPRDFRFWINQDVRFRDLDTRRPMPIPAPMRTTMLSVDSDVVNLP
jgi:hypothetical protein